MILSAISVSSPYQYQPYNFQSTPAAEASTSKSSEISTEANLSSKEIQSGEICQTCKERKYQDGSDDPSVSFKAAGHIDPEDSAAVVNMSQMNKLVLSLKIRTLYLKVYLYKLLSVLNAAGHMFQVVLQKLQQNPKLLYLLILINQI